LFFLTKLLVYVLLIGLSMGIIWIWVPFFINRGFFLVGGLLLFLGLEPLFLSLLVILNLFLKILAFFWLFTYEFAGLFWLDNLIMLISLL